MHCNADKQWIDLSKKTTISKPTDTDSHISAHVIILLSVQYLRNYHWGVLKSNKWFSQERSLPSHLALASAHVRIFQPKVFKIQHASFRTAADKEIVITYTKNEINARLYFLGGSKHAKLKMP